MMVVIPYTRDIHNGWELQHAIRSMVKHFKDMTGVLLIGDRPGWFTGEHIPARDYNGYPARKEFSIVQKILKCPYDDFLLTQDDVYANQDFDATIPNYHNGLLSAARVHGRYQRRVRAVMELYPNGMFYDIHCPMVVNRDKYHEANAQADWAAKEYLQKSLYGNFVGGGELLPDCKVRDGNESITAPFFSTDDLTAKFVNLEEMYPEKSEYET